MTIHRPVFMAGVMASLLLITNKENIMAKIQSAGKGIIKIGKNLINPKQYKEIAIHTFGEYESPEGYICGIQVTPLSPSKEDIENGVVGSYFITTYKGDHAEEEMNADFATLKKSMTE